MKMLVTSEGANVPYLVLVHGDQTLLWDLSCFNRNHLNGNTNVTEHINAYWAQLPPYRQDKIWSCYVQIRTMFEEVHQISNLCVGLMPLIKLLYLEHNLDDLEKFLVYQTDVRVPIKFDEYYAHTDEKPFTRERTYTRPDYMKLITLTLMLRFMIPVWGEFIMRTKVEAGTNFKEYIAYSLLAQTQLADTLAMEKLRIYLDGNIQTEKNLAAIEMSGVGIENYPNWVLAGVLVKRLSVADIRGLEAHTDLVVTIHNDIKAKNAGSGGGFGEPMLSKKFDADSDNEQGPSRLENFKIKAKHSTGDIAAIKFFMSDYKRAARQLDAKISPTLLSRLVKGTQALQNEQLSACQITIAQWVLAPICSPRGMFHLRKDSILTALAIAQAWLWTHDHKNLAGLITAIASTDGSARQLSGMGSGNSALIRREQMDSLNELFPYSRVSAKRKNTIPVNTGVASINSVAELFGTQDWILTIPDPFAQEIIGNQLHRRYSCPHDIKISLAKLVIELASR